jgi:FixJ family two-component response regulator
MADTGKDELPKKPLILIVDDDEALRDATKGLMRALGFRAEAFGAAEDLLKSDLLHCAACIISDMQMPQMSGLEMHRRLVESGTSIPTILITAYPDDSVRTRALKAGIICYLTKPFSKDDVLACIRSVLDRGPAGPSPEGNVG